MKLENVLLALVIISMAIFVTGVIEINRTLEMIGSGRDDKGLIDNLKLSIEQMDKPWESPRSMEERFILGGDSLLIVTTYYKNDCIILKDSSVLCPTNLEWIDSSYINLEWADHSLMESKL